MWPGGPPEPPYDVAGWTLGLQMGVDVTPIDTPLTAPRRAVTSPAEALLACHARQAARSSGDAGALVALDPRNTDSYRAVARALRGGTAVRVADGAVPTAGGDTIPPGAFLLPRAAAELAARESATAAMPRRAASAGDIPWRSGIVCPVPVVLSTPTGRVLRRFPRVALYRPWTGNIDEGWTRWVLEQFDIPYTGVTDSVVRAGKLRDHFDVLLVPDMSFKEMREGMSPAAVPPAYAGGLGEAGIDAIRAFVRAGGTVVLLDGASALATDALGVPVRRIAAARDAGTAQPYAPGSILRVLVDATQPVAYGMPDTAAVYFTNSVTFDVPADASAHVLARYPARAEDILLSGWLRGASAIAGKAAAVEAPVGAGRVVMFGFRVQHRGQSYGTFRLLFNALLSGGDAAAAGS
jgi:hypothetical protein